MHGPCKYACAYQGHNPLHTVYNFSKPLEQLEQPKIHNGAAGVSGPRVNVATLLEFNTDIGFAFQDLPTLDIRCQASI